MEAGSFSVYKLNESDVVWAITEADRSSTCLLIAGELLICREPEMPQSCHRVKF